LSSSDYLFGVHAITALLRKAPSRVLSLKVIHSKLDSLESMLQQPNCQHIRLEVVTMSDLTDLLGEDCVHQGVAARCKGPLALQESDLTKILAHSSEPLVLLLDQVQDPHNLGACIRTANAMGVDCIIIPKDNAVGLTSTVEKVACGAAAVTPVIQVVNLSRTMKSLQQSGLWLVGLDMDGEGLIDSVDLAGPIGIVMGGEGKGLRNLTKKNCDHLVKIGMSGTVTSLNVSVATAIALYEVAQQRRV
jgi:23S rRNA (guanosine2251-2'-O)-methyltransferase